MELKCVFVALSSRAVLRLFSQERGSVKVRKMKSCVPLVNAVNVHHSHSSS